MISAKDRLGIFKLEPLNISDSLASIVSDRIEFEFQQVNRYDLIERQNIDKVLSEQSFQQTGVTDSMVEIGKILNVQYMLIGSSTGNYVVEATFKNFLLSAPKTCIRQLLHLDKVKQVSTVSEEKIPTTQIKVINYIQKQQVISRKHFSPCYYC
jgi:hypothetical protein